MDLTDEHTLTTGMRVVPDSELLLELTKSADQLGTGGDHARFIGWPHDLMYWRSASPNEHPPGGGSPSDNGQVVAERLGEQDRITDNSVSNHLIQLLPEPPGRFVQVVRGEQDVACRQGIRIAKHAQGLDRGGSSAFHVGCARAGQSAILDGRWDKGEVDGVEMTVELQRRARPRAAQPNDHGRGLCVSCGNAINDEAVRSKDLCQSIQDGTRFTRPAGNSDEILGRPQQTIAANGVAKMCGDGVGAHDRVL
jgi:hypothetical protein